METTAAPLEIYLDANATTPVLPQARAAAMDAMAQEFGNPSSTHSTGLRARALIDEVRARARRVLGTGAGHLLFVSGATEGIQTAVLSGLSSLKGRPGIELLLYGATEHKAVPEALHHWNDLLGLGLQVLPIPVSRDGLHDLQWLRQRATRAGMVCTMAANNETGVISDLDGIAQALAGSPALWMVDSVQALGKLALDLARRPIDYAPFSGHKLYAPKGIGLLYVRPGAPITPLMAGGGQEGALRSGTENVSGIAALGAVLQALGDGATFHDEATLKVFRNQIAAALVEAFPALQFNAPQDLCLPTTLNFSVPGLNSRLLLDLFDAAGVRVSGGSACSAGKAGSSHVLEAMGLPAWRAASAIRLSFGPAAERAFIDEACQRIRACSAALRLHCVSTGRNEAGEPLDGITRFAVNGRCCYLVADAASRSCIVVDPQQGLADRLAQLLGCHGYRLQAVLQTRDPGDQAAQALCSALPAGLGPQAPHGAPGWPADSDEIQLGRHRVTRLPVQAGPASNWAYVLQDPAHGVKMAFVGDAVVPGTSGGQALDQHGRRDHSTLLSRLEQCVGRQGLLLPGFDPADAFATTVSAQAEVRTAPAQGGNPQADGPVELGGAALRQLLKSCPGLVLVDVREPYEQHLSAPPDLGRPVRSQAVALSSVINALPGWLDQAAITPLLFFCRSGGRSSQAARALRRLGHPQAWSLAGGLALWQ